ncbi:MAG: hypothetical protein FJX34_03105 [Alphaproteobacteria bacterium]|nr:hypothetical protein [Alphaproteobacteria bacterium]
MPQFDFTTYSSQIFWFSLCFLALYCAAHFVILPRVREILTARKNVIKSDKSATHTLEKKITNLQNTAEQLRREASERYESRIEETSRQTAKQKDKTLGNLKENLDSTITKTRLEIKSFLEKSEANANAAAEALSQKIQSKLLS